MREREPDYHTNCLGSCLQNSSLTGGQNGWNDFIRAGQVSLLALVLLVFFSFSGGTTQVLCERAFGNLTLAVVALFLLLVVSPQKHKKQKQLQGTVSAFLNSSHCVSAKTPQRFPSRKWCSHPLVGALETGYVTFMCSWPRLQSQFLVQFHCFKCLNRSWIPVDTN